MDEPWVRGLLDADPASIGSRPDARVVKENAVRTVWRVPSPGGAAAYLKLFRVSPLAAATKYLVVPSRAKAEWEASRGLRAAGIPAAEVLGFTEIRTSGLLSRAACVVKEFPDALELVPWMHRRWGREGPWTPEQAAARRALLVRLGQVLRKLHDAGFRHPDLHGGNLLLAKEGEPPEMCLIDLHTVSRGTSDREGDLATLLHSLLTATDEAERGILRAAYGGGADAPESRLLAMEARRLASRCSPAKLFGPTGRFGVETRGDLRMIFLRSWGAEPFAGALEAHAASKDALKRGGRSTVTRVEVPGPSGPVRLIVKETKVRGAMDLLKNALRRPRAMESWAGGNGLWHRDIDCAEPRACIVRGGWPLRRESFLVMEDVSAGGERFDLRSLRLWGGGGPLRGKKEEIARLGRFVGDLHARGVYHGDFKAVNVFVRRKHGRDSFCLVDYDRVDFGAGPVPARRRWKNLAQLAASVGKYFTRADRLRFYRSYAESLPGAWDERKTAARAVAEACARKIVVVRAPIE